MAGTSFELYGDASGLLSALGKSEKAFADLNKTAEQSGQGIDKVMEKLNGLASIAGVSFGAAGMAAFAKKIYEARSAMQDLESTMKVFLGSEEKAAKFTKELQNYAYWNMFEFTDLTEASTQLMAYGTATEDLIPIIDKLSNVATGTKKPLQDYIELFNKAKATGKVDANGLERWAAAGIVLKDELKKMNVEVSGSTVTFKQLEQVLDKVTSDGERFGGLMMSQMDNLSASWGQLEDNFANMLNELGTELQDVFKGGIDFASTLIDNYDKIGKALATLILMYGEYKAVLIATRAIQSANVLLDNIRLIGMFRKELGLLKAAQQAFNITAMQNPYILLASVLIMTVTAIVGLTRAFSDNRTELEKVNDAYDERIRGLEDEQRLSNELIRTLKDETASYEALALARLKLADLPAFENYEAGEIAVMTPEEVQQILNDYYAKEKAQAAKDLVQGHKDNLANSINAYAANKNYSETSPTSMSFNPQAVNAAVEAAKKNMESAKETAKELVSIDISKITDMNDDLNAQKSALEEAQKAEKGYLEVYEKSVEELRKKESLDKGELKRLRQHEVLLETTKVKIEEYGNALRKVNNDIANAGNNPKDQGSTYAQLVKAIKDKEEEVYAAREAYKALTSENNKEALTERETELKGLTDKYKLATGQTWQDTKKLTEDETKLLNKAIADRLKAESHFLSDRHKRELQYHEDLRKLNEEEAEYNKKNNGGTEKSKRIFAVRRQTIELEYKNDKETFMREFNEMIREVEQEVIDIRTSMDNAELERAIDLATSYEEKIKKQNELFEAQKKQRTEELALEEQKTAEEKFGKDTIERYNQYKSGDYAPASEAEKATFENIEEFYDLFLQKRQAVMQQMEQENSFAILDQELQHYEEYVQGMLDAETAYQEELARIREENGLSADADIENSNNAVIQSQVQKAKDQREASQDIVKRDTGLTDDKWVTELGNLGANVAGKAYEEIKKLYDEFINSVNEDIAEIEAQKVAAEKIADGGDAKALKADAQEQLSGVETQLLDPNLNEQKKNELLQQQIELKAQIAYYDAVEQGNAATLNDLTARGAQLVKVRTQAEANASTAQQKALTKEQLQQIKANRQKEVAIQGLETVRDTANAVANTFGGALSKKAKKALDTISQVADFGIDAVKGVESIVNGVSKGMEATSTAAATSMSTVEKASVILEKASVILTIISVAVQLVMKIVEIASQFTKSAQLQNSIDDHLAKVDELEKKQQMIEAQYATSQGSEYYKGLAESAEAYNAIIKENKAALDEAEELYNHNLSKYGEDSDKTEEAKAQRDDLALQDQEFQNSQIEAWRGLMEELSGTSLDSFAENLADSLIEGFAMGKEGIDGVWEDTMDDLLRTMMRNQLATALKDQFKSTFDSLTEATKDGDLSQAEMEEFMNNLEAGKETAEQIAGAYYDAMSEAGLLDDADAEGSQGFGQMTQDQADTLTARFTAVQMEMANVSANTQAMANVVSLVGEDIKLGVASIQSLLYNSNIALQIAQDQLDQMQIIADNTSMLAETNTRLKAIEQNTGRL